MERNLRVLGFGAAIRAFGLSLIGPFFALYLHNVQGLPFAQVGLLTAAVALPPLFLTPVGGLLADRVGRRRVFLCSLVGESACLLAVGAGMQRADLDGVVGGFLAFNVVADLGGPALSAYIADFAQGSARTEGFTWFRIGHNVGFTLGVFTGGALVGFLGFAPVALVASAFSLGAAILGAVLLEPSPFDRALRLGNADRQRRARRSVGESLRLLAADRPFLELGLAFGLVSLVAGEWAVTYPVFVVDDLHLSYAILGSALALNGLVVVVGQAPTTRAVAGRRHTSLGVWATLSYASGFLLLAVAGAFDLVPAVALYASVIVLTLGENLLFIPTSTLPSNVAPPDEIGSYNGAFQTIQFAGTLGATTLGGFALGGITNPLELWSVLCLPVVPAIWLLGRVAGRLQPSADRA